MKEWILENTEITEEEYDKIINPNTVYIKDLTPISTDINKKHPFYNILTFTEKKANFFRNKIYKIKQIKSNSHNHYIHQNIEFYILGEHIKYLTYLMYSKDRYGKCFYINSKICLLTNNSYLTTALCTSPFYNDKQFIHSFVTIQYNNKEYILDGIYNIIIEKEIYFNIFNPKIISNIPREQLKSDLENIIEFEKVSQIYRGEYLCFPTQIMQSIKKRTKKDNHQ